MTNTNSWEEELDTWALMKEIKALGFSGEELKDFIRSLLASQKAELAIVLRQKIQEIDDSNIISDSGKQYTHAALYPVLALLVPDSKETEV